MAETFQIGDYVAFADTSITRSCKLVSCKGTVERVMAGIRSDQTVWVRPDPNDTSYIRAMAAFKNYWERHHSFSTSSNDLILIRREGQVQHSSCKQNNDGRTHCYSCGALTQPVDCGLPGSKMRYCPKCKK